MAKNFIIVILAALLVLAGWKIFKKPMDNDKKNEEATSTPSAMDLLSVESDYEVGADVVEYLPGVKGYYAEPTEEGDYPGVVMVHEWWGLNDNIKGMAKALASQGYRVLAVDLFGGKEAKTSEEAQILVKGVNQAEALKNMRAAADYLRDQGSQKIASLGWCFGGGQSLAFAISGEKLDATVIYYGTPLVSDKNEIANIEWPVLGIFGDKDTAIPVSQVREFEGALITNDIRNEIHIYPGVGHAFANPTGPNYAPEETIDAWKKTLSFLDKYLKS